MKQEKQTMVHIRGFEESKCSKLENHEAFLPELAQTLCRGSRSTVVLCC